MNTEERTITIVDDIMGSGKSTWAINYINDNPDRKFLYQHCYNGCGEVRFVMVNRLIFIFQVSV